VNEPEQERLEIERLTVGKRIVSFDFGVYDKDTLNLHSITLDGGTVIRFSASDYDNIVMVSVK